MTVNILENSFETIRGRGGKMGFKIVNNVLETTNHQIFRLEETNRDVEKTGRLMDDINALGQINPIVVNENMVVIDGQHRLEACKKLGIPIKFIIVQGIGRPEMISMNTTSKNWTLKDYINSYTKAGKTEYIKLKEFLDDGLIQTRALVSIAQNKADGSYSVDAVKRGEFRFYNIQTFYDFFEKYREFVFSTRVKTISGLAMSYYRLFKLRKFDSDRMIEKSAGIREVLRGISSEQMILEILLETYNANTRAGSKIAINYYYDRNKNLILDEEVRQELLPAKR